MVNSISTPNRLTVMLPVVKRTRSIEEWMQDVEAQESMRRILHRKAVSTGKALLVSSNGRPRPIVQLMQSKGLKRLKAGESPVAIINDLQAQLKLVI
jgi:hypothetical protein